MIILLKIVRTLQSTHCNLATKFRLTQSDDNLPMRKHIRNVKGSCDPKSMTLGAVGQILLIAQIITEDNRL